MTDDSGWLRELEVETRTSAGTPPVSEDGGALRVPGVTILFHPRMKRVGERTPLPELMAGRPVHLSRLEPMFFAPGSGKGRPLADSHLSRTPIRWSGRPQDGWALERGDHRGEVLVNGEPLGHRRGISLEDLEAGVTLQLAQGVLLWLHLVDPVPQALPSFDLVGESHAISELRRDIQRAASLEVPVLIQGASGSGKELVARAIHRASGRAEGPYQAVNMAAIPETLAAAELFGSAKGAFTGATARQGFFERAQGGSLFLDEVGETPVPIQAMLLRCLENHEVQPVGAVATRPVDVRVLAATDANLGRAIEAGRFRLPLLHRLAGYEIHLPPLTERRDDIPRLLVHFLRQEATQLGESGAALLGSPDWTTPESMARLVGRPWPGNVRELRNVARRLVLRSPGPVEIGGVTAGAAVAGATVAGAAVQVGESAPADGHGEPADDGGEQRTRAPYRKPAEVSEDELLAALKAQRWRLKPTAEALGVSRGSLYLMIESCDGIRKAVDLTRDEICDAERSMGGDLTAMAEHLEVSEQGLKRRMSTLGLR